MWLASKEQNLEQKENPLHIFYWVSPRSNFMCFNPLSFLFYHLVFENLILCAVLRAVKSVSRMRKLLKFFFLLEQRSLHGTGEKQTMEDWWGVCKRKESGRSRDADNEAGCVPGGRAFYQPQQKSAQPVFWVCLLPQVVLGCYQCNFPSITGKQHEVRSDISDQFSWILGEALYRWRFLVNKWPISELVFWGDSPHMPSLD